MLTCGHRQRIDEALENWAYERGDRHITEFEKGYVDEDDKDEFEDLVDCNMKWIAERLSQNNPFLRVDLYEVNEKVYFGEMTFYPASGLGRFTPEDWDHKMGEWLELPSKIKA